MFTKMGSRWDAEMPRNSEEQDREFVKIMGAK
jgi:hypothetical protein